MGISSELLEDIKEAFDDDLSDAVSSFAFNRYSSAYNSTTGTTSRIVIESDLIRGLIYNFTTREIEHSKGSIEVGDLRILILQSEILTFSDNAIRIDDILINGPEGKDYRVLNAPLDPSGTLYMAHLRVYDGS